MMEGSIRFPEGWTSAGPLQPNERASVTTYIDSPVVSGRYLKTVDLPSGTAPKHRINLTGESRGAIDTWPTFAEDYGRLVAEAGALFGAYHFRHYDWLVTLSDDVAHFGLEHHESSDNRMEERRSRPSRCAAELAGLLSHEYVHSWNAKYRRPAIMLSPDYQQPMEGNLLWVYEGLTQYLASLLATRAGLWPAEYYREDLADVAARFDVQPGRTLAAALRYRGGGADALRLADGMGEHAAQHGLLRRSDPHLAGGRLHHPPEDEQPRLARRLSPPLPRRHQRRSGSEAIHVRRAGGRAEWRGAVRLAQALRRAPRLAQPARARSAGITNNGWKVAFNDTPNEAIKANEERRKIIDLTYSLGMTLKNGENPDDKGTVRDVWIGGPAANAGIGPGMKIIAVNGRRWTRSVLEKALRDKGPLELLVQNNDDFRTHTVDYRGGLRYPHLVREDGKSGQAGGGGEGAGAVGVPRSSSECRSRVLGGAESSPRNPDGTEALRGTR